MNRPSPPTEAPVRLAQVWSGLPSDLQQRAVRLLAQLAYVRLRPQAPLPTKGVRHADPTQQSQDSSRPS
jgi:hypothetical protein